MGGELVPEGGTVPRIMYGVRLRIISDPRVETNGVRRRHSRRGFPSAV